MDRHPESVAVYDDDFTLWVERQVDALRNARLEQLDITNLIDELEGIVQCQKHALSSRLKVIIQHLLKCQYQPERKSDSWLATLDVQRDRIGYILRSSPSLRRLLSGFAHDEYPRAVRRASRETGIPIDAFPATIPYTVEQLLDDDFIP